MLKSNVTESLSQTEILIFLNNFKIKMPLECLMWYWYPLVL